MKNRTTKVLFIISLILLCVLIGIIIFITARKNLTTDKSQDEISPNTVNENSNNIIDSDDKLITPENPDTQLDNSDTAGEENIDDVTTIDNDLAIDSKASITLAFAGDILFDEGSKPIAHYDKVQKGIEGVISSDLVVEMIAADIMMLNNEFPYSTRGTKTPDKSYTFRADPSRVNILHEMGVDIVSLANNHALDYGVDAMLDTFDTLEDANVDYVGAGDTLDRAKEPIYLSIGDTKIAYLSASKVIFATSWTATDSNPGMLSTYDPTLLISSIKEASKNSDFVVVFVHWGIESNNLPEEYQRTFAKKYIDAGADVVIGGHPHVMQGFEYYKGKPIVYSLGNFWFSSYKRESGLIKLVLDPNDSVKMQLLPVMTGDLYTYLLTEKDEIQTYFDYMEEISFGVTIDEEGYITENVD